VWVHCDSVCLWVSTSPTFPSRFHFVLFISAFLATEYVPWLWVPFHLLQEVLQYCAIYRNLKEFWSIRAAALAYQPMVQELGELSSKCKIWTYQHCLSCRPVKVFEWQAYKIMWIVKTINGGELYQISFYKKYETELIVFPNFLWAITTHFFQASASVSANKYYCL
jgi:hypothetical protein